MNLRHPFAVTLLATLLLALAWPLDALHGDTTRDFLLVRDCLELGRCETAGAASSLADVHLGASWLDLLALGRTWLAPWGVALLLALLTGAAVVASAGRKQVAALAVLMLVALATGPEIIVNTTAMWPFCLLATALALTALQQPGLPQWLLVGALLGVAADLHAAAWPLTWALAAVAWHRGQRRGAGLVLLTALATTLAYSPRAWELFATAVHAHPLYALIAVGPLLVWLLLWPLARLQPVQQLTLVGVLTALAAGFAHQFTVRYAMPFVGAAVLALAPWLTQHKAWRPLAIAAFAMIFLWRQGTVELSWSATERVAHAAEQQGVGWPQILTQLRGERAATLAEATAVYLPLQPLQHAQPLILVSSHGAIQGAKPTHSRLDMARTLACTARDCQPIDIEPGPRSTPAPFAGRAMPRQLPLPETFAPFELRIPVLAGAPTRVVVPQRPRGTRYWLRAPFLRDVWQPDAANEPCDWHFADGSQAVQLNGDAQELRLRCVGLLNGHGPSPALLPSLVETCAQDDACDVAGDPSPVALPPSEPLPEPLRFNRSPTAARLGGVWALLLFGAALVRLGRRG
jgi:hypothetical protein